jgi:hypothetical protein
MKKFLKIGTIILVSLVVFILAFIYISYNTWSPGEVKANVDPSALNYYQNSYSECRESFRKLAEKMKFKFDSVEVFPIRVNSRTDNDLTIDVCYIPAQKEKSNLLILSSGSHGVEGFVGSAVQQMVMKELLNKELVAETGVLFIHAINPYGFKNFRRVSENNVDLNRNFEVTTDLFSLKNQGYSNLYGLLNPEGKANLASLKNRFFLLTALQNLVKESKKSLRQAIMQGQYQYEKGLYYGGQSFEPQVSLIAPVLTHYSRNYRKIMDIDLHSGYGELGVLHLFPDPVKDVKVKTAVEQVFAGHRIDWGDSDDFYTTYGGFSDYIGKLLPDKFYMPMVFEFGTLNSQTTLGIVHSLQNMILENQGAHYGYSSDWTKEEIFMNFREMYCPSSQAWRSKAINDSRDMMETVFRNF